MSARQSYAQRRASRRSSRSSDLLHPHLLDLATRARARSEVSSSSFGAASGSLTGVGSSAGGDGRGTASASGPGMGGHETIVSPIPQRILSPSLLSPSSIPTSQPPFPPSLPNPNPAQTLSKTNPQTRQKPTHKHPDAPIKNLIRSLSHSLPTRWVLLVCLAFVLLIKLLVGLGGYSGQSPPVSSFFPLLSIHHLNRSNIPPPPTYLSDRSERPTPIRRFRSSAVLDGLDCERSIGRGVV